jgi:DnaJ-class molecular chaperone
MANQIAKNMSMDEKGDLDSMDMNEMISHVTKNVLSMMNNGNNMQQTQSGNENGAPAFQFPGMPPGFNPASIFNAFSQQEEQQQQEQPEQLDNSGNESDFIYAKTRDICFDLNVDLEDFYTGKKKKLNVKRKRMIEVDGKQTVIEEKKKIIIPIEKGMKDDQQIRFEGEADQIPGYKPGDIVITLIENDHPIFQRDGDNLIIIKNINLYQIYDYSFDITHLDLKVLRILKTSSDALHLNDSLRKITGQGMPIYKNSSVFGDLFIRFNLVIPKSLEPDQLNKLKEIFDDSEPLAQSFDKLFLLENVSETDIEDLDSESDTETSDSGSDVSISSVSSDDSPRVGRRR